MKKQPKSFVSQKFNELLLPRYNTILKFLGDGKTSEEIAVELGITLGNAQNAMYKLLNLGYVVSDKVKGLGSKPKYVYTALKLEIEEENIGRKTNPFEKFNSAKVEKTAIETGYPKLSSFPQMLRDIFIQGRVYEEQMPQRHPMDKVKSPKVYIGCSFDLV